MCCPHSSQQGQLRSIRDSVLRPATIAGWNTSLLIDIVVPLPRRAAWQELCADVFGFAPTSRFSSLHLGSTQGASLLSSLAWATRAAPTLWTEREVLLLLRADVHFKSVLPPPPPAADDVCIWLPFHLVNSDQRPCTERQPSKVSVADTVLWVPRLAHASFLDALHRRPPGGPPMNGPPPSNLHALYQVLAVRNRLGPSQPQGSAQ